MSIHDVTPAMAEGARALWQLCREHDIVPALLVVPNWHGEWPLSAHPDFIAWLQQCSRNGAEIMLHGERHDEWGLPRSWRDSLRAVGRTAREGEFLTLREHDAYARICRGLAVLRSFALDPVGFVAPAWLSHECTHDAVARADLLVSEDIDSVRVHRGVSGSSGRVRTPVIRWSARTRWRAGVSAWVAAAQWHRQRTAAVVRIALHPQDLASPVAARSVRRELARWAAARCAVSYASLAAARLFARDA